MVLVVLIHVSNTFRVIQNMATRGRARTARTSPPAAGGVVAGESLASPVATNGPSFRRRRELGDGIAEAPLHQRESREWRGDFAKGRGNIEVSALADGYDADVRAAVLA